MARTKQTANKSTGGYAMRKMELRGSKSTPEVEEPPQDTPDVEMSEVAANPSAQTSDLFGSSQQEPAGGDSPKNDDSDNWCHICNDGDDSRLVVCDRCGSATCTRCVPSLGEVTDIEPYEFRCIRCTDKGSVFYGLYKPDNTPLYPDGMAVTAHNPVNGHKQRVEAPHLVIIELVLEELPHEGTAGQLLYLSLKPYYLLAHSRLSHERIFFDVPFSTDAAKTHKAKMTRLVTKLRKGGYDRVVLIIHTHSDGNTGDLWYTSHDPGFNNTPLAAAIDSFFDTYVGERMMEYIREMKFSAFFLLACGSVVTRAEALARLQATVKRVRFTDSFAFGAERLISNHVGIWMISYAGQVIIGGQPTVDCINSLLYASSIGKHTSVTYINKGVSDGKESFNTARYIWEHPVHRPNTYSFPISCESCRRIYSWKIPSRARQGEPAKLTCKAKLANGEKCGYTWEVPALPDSADITPPFVGIWRKLIQ